MAHNLSKKKDGSTAFAAVVDGTAVRQTPWHGLGTFVPKAMTSKEAIELGGLDYTVTTVPLKWSYGTGKAMVTGESTNRVEVIREDTKESLGTIGSGFQLLQNVEAFEFFDSLVGDPKKDGNKIAMFETVGALGRGEKIFITAKLPSQIKVGKGDFIDQYLFLYMGHDGSTPITCAFTPVRIVCNNTLNAALRNCSNKVVIKHTKNAKSRFKEAQQIMGMVNQSDKLLSEMFGKMAKVKITDQKLKEYIASVMSPAKEIITPEEFESEFSTRTLNQVEEIFKYAQTHPTQLMETTKGTVFGAYNAITGYYQNIKEWSDGNDKVDKLVISELATEKKKVQKAFDFAQMLAIKS